MNHFASVPIGSTLVVLTHPLSYFLHYLQPPFSSETLHSLIADNVNVLNVLLVLVEPYINPLKTKSRLLYLKTQFIPRIRHFSSQL